MSSNRREWRAARYWVGFGLIIMVSFQLKLIWNSCGCILTARQEHQPVKPLRAIRKRVACGAEGCSDAGDGVGQARPEARNSASGCTCNW